MHLNKAWIANSGFPNLALICSHLFSPPLLTNVLGIKISKILRYMKKRWSKADKMLYSFDSLAYVYASKRKTSFATVRFGATCDGSWNHGHTIGAAEFQPGCTLLTWWHQPTVKRQYIIIRVYKKLQIPSLISRPWSEGNEASGFCVRHGPVGFLSGPGWIFYI